MDGGEGRDGVDSASVDRQVVEDVGDGQVDTKEGVVGVGTTGVGERKCSVDKTRNDRVHIISQDLNRERGIGVRSSVEAGDLIQWKMIRLTIDDSINDDSINNDSINN